MSMGPGSGPPGGPIQSLPIGGTVSETYRIFRAQLPFLPRALAAPLALSVMVSILAYAIPGLTGLMWLLSLVPYTIFGMTWYRLTLLGPQAGQPGMAPTWSRDHNRFFGYSLLITFFLLLSSSFFILAGGGSSGALLTGLVVTLGVLYATTRMSLIFPAIAVGEAYSLRDAWQHSKGEGLRLLAALLLTLMPILLLLVAIGMLVALGYSGSEDLTQSPDTLSPEALEKLSTLFAWLQVLNLIVSYLSLALMTTMIAIAFQTLTGWVPHTPNLPAERDEE